MNENYICVDNKYYDPYFILEVDQDDDLDFIIKCFKNKAKKYHPDKATSEKEKIKNEKRFKILTKCIEFIKQKRESSFINTHDRKKEYKHLNKNTTKNFKDNGELNDFNNSFIEKSYSKDKFKNVNNIKNNIDREIDITLINQFTSKKFSNDNFNLIFDYNSLKNKKQTNENKQLIHYTTDGFYGYNTSDLDQYALVHTYNGLLISNDLIDITDINYGNNYSDFNDIYTNQVKNPDKIIRLSKQEKEKIKQLLEKKRLKAKKSSNYLYNNENNDNESITYDNESITYKNDYEKQQYNLYKMNLSNLEKQQKKDKDIILNSGIYDSNLIKDAQDGLLDMSPSLLRALDEHYKFKRLN